MHVINVYAPIAALDLSTVRTRLMHPRAGLGWGEARTLAAESAYREFLLYAKQYPAETPSPTADVDAFWHYHILDTVKYARDCQRAFGYFLHHKPDVEFCDEDAQAEEAVAADMSTYCARGPAQAAYCALVGAPAYARNEGRQSAGCGRIRARITPDRVTAGRGTQAHYA